MVKLLVKNARVDAGAQHDSGLTPFQIALFNSNKVVESLLAMQDGTMVDDAYNACNPTVYKRYLYPRYSIHRSHLLYLLCWPFDLSTTPH